MVVEADEFDRSFLQLYPDVAVVTAVDADHLDIYGTHEAVKEAFSEFVGQIRPGGALILKQGVELDIRNDRIRVYRYAYDTPCDFYADRIRLEPDGRHTFDLVCPDRVIRDCTPGVPGWVNVEKLCGGGGDAVGGRVRRSEAAGRDRVVQRREAPV